MRSITGLLAVAAVTLLLSGCVADSPFQNSQTAGSPALLEETAYESEGTRGSYVLSHVEFDDQGWFHDRQQRLVLFKTLSNLKEQSKRMLIVTYTHGWKHNAKETDQNLRDFGKLLANLDSIERAAKRTDGPRTVVGVYVGWRGASLEFPLLDELTFWARKNAAERVGARSVKQLFIELNQFRSVANKTTGVPDQLADANSTQLIFVGHSFGGLITYHALYSEILERGLQLNESGRYRTAKSFGDFVLLVNPAFEGSAYEPIWHAATTRGCYPPWQRPVMAIVTSRADNATRVAFPAGRLYTYFQSAPQPGARDTVMHTVGHLDRYRTHRLEPISLGQVPDAVTPEAVAKLDISSARPNAQEVTILSDVRMVKSSTKTPLRMPYLVIEADKDLIADHNDFWNDRFRIFTVNFIASQILAPLPSESTGDDCPAFGEEAATTAPMTAAK